MARRTKAFVEKNLWTPYGTRTIHPVEPPAKWNWARNHNVWPFASGLELEGRFEQVDFNGALHRLRACWGNMIDKGAECFWGMLDPRGGSFITHVPVVDTGMDGDTWSWYDHGWSAGVGYLMQACLLGVRCLTPGFRRFLVSPRLGYLSHAAWIDRRRRPSRGRASIRDHRCARGHRGHRAARSQQPWPCARLCPWSPLPCCRRVIC
jgi:hypothetical protein